LIRKTLTDESGYSLVEVIVSILLLSIAIIPMVGMFDTGLKTATSSGNYDGARALAYTNLEKVRSLPYADAKVNYKPVNATPPAGTTVSCDTGMYTCGVTTTYVDNSLSANSAATTKMQVVVTVQWAGGHSFTTTGLVAQ
jgi:Tfp pilus assembly protein PilV